MDGKQVVEMRMDGKTFQEIAVLYGVSKQAVHQKFNSYIKILKGDRGRSVDGRRFNIAQIPYKGLYEHFEKNEKESVCSFCKRIIGKEPTSFVAKMRNFLVGENDSRFTIAQIKKICEIVGEPFEKVFEERVSVEKADGTRRCYCEGGEHEDDVQDVG